MDLTINQMTREQARAQVVEAIYQETAKRAAAYFNRQGVHVVSKSDLEACMDRIYREQKPEIDRKIALENQDAWNHVCLFQDYTKTFLDGDHPTVKRRAGIV